MSIHELIPDVEALLALEPEELAGVLLQDLNGVPADRAGQLNRYNYTLESNLQDYPRDKRNEVAEAITEAWVWLEREGLLAPSPGHEHDWVFITRRGRKLTTAEDVAAYRRYSLLPRHLLHPRIAQKVWATFLRGDYDTAVFQSMKEVEVAVRDAGDFDSSDFGVGLMRKAFHPQTGPLIDTSADSLIPEREALMHLFAGAIGIYKNPHSHRDVAVGPKEAIEVLMLASHLLGIVEKRQANT
jgi:uncharacterized protein (TIGR02391 family)